MECVSLLSWWKHSYWWRGSADTCEFHGMTVSWDAQKGQCLNHDVSYRLAVSRSGVPIMTLSSTIWSVQLSKIGQGAQTPIKHWRANFKIGALDLAIRATLNLLARDSIENLLVYRRNKVYDLERIKRWSSICFALQYFKFSDPVCLSQMSSNEAAIEKIREFSMLLMERLDYSQDLPCWLFLSFARGETDISAERLF